MKISCLKCGKSGAAYEEFCAHCGTKYPLKMVVIDIDMRFTSMIMFMIKWAIAAIPAMIIIYIIYSFTVGVFKSMLHS